MSTRKESPDLKLDREEEELLLAFEKGDLKYELATKAGRAEAAGAARTTLKGDKRMNIRVSSMDMLELQTKAAKLGMPYQTLVSSVLHQYLTGRLKPSDNSPAPHAEAVARHPRHRRAVDRIQPDHTGQARLSAGLWWRYLECHRSLRAAGCELRLHHAAGE